MTRRPDPVASGTAALRRLTADDASAGDVTRARLLARLNGRRPHVWLSRRTALLVVLPLIASTALAATVLTRARSTEPARATLQAPPSRSGRTAAPARAIIIAEAISSEEAPAADLGPPATVHQPIPRRAAAADAELFTYGAAHKAHFVGLDFARALRLWNGYLHGFPRGRFVPEATYNRAIALVRLGRRGEAITALRPIAAGRLDGYRQAEAQALLKVLHTE